MPEISRFFGIVVQMYYADHDPPHFHVRYAGQRALLRLKRLRSCVEAFRRARWRS
jgi:hypothetical protein